MHKTTEKLLNKKGRKIASLSINRVAKSNQFDFESSKLLILLISLSVKI